MAELGIEHLAASQHHTNQIEATTTKQSPEHAYNDDISLLTKVEETIQDKGEDSSIESEDTEIEQSSDNHPASNLNSSSFAKQSEGPADVEKEHIVDNNEPHQEISDVSTADQIVSQDESMQPKTIEQSDPQEIRKVGEAHKESSQDKVIIDGFVITAFQTWEELQDKINEQIAIQKSNESKKDIAKAAKKPRKIRNRSEPKASTTSDLTQEQKAKGKDGEKTPKKRTKKVTNSSPMPREANMEIPPKRKKERNRSKKSNQPNQGSKSSVVPNVKNDPKPQGNDSQQSPQVHNHMPNSQDGNTSRCGEPCRTNSGPTQTKYPSTAPFISHDSNSHIDKSQTNRQHLHNGNHPYYNNHEHSQSYPNYACCPPGQNRAPVYAQKHLPKPASSTINSELGRPVQNVPSGPASSMPNQSYTQSQVNHSQYNYSQHSQSSSSYPYSPFPYQYQYPSSPYIRHPHPPPPMYGPGFSYQAPPYQNPYHHNFYPVPYALQSSHQMPTQPPSSLPGQYAASQYHPSSFSAYPAYGYSPYIITDTTISRQTSIKPQPHVTQPPANLPHQGFQRTNY